jgi:hypothetical protein
VLLLVALLALTGCPGGGYPSCDEARKAGAAPLHRGDQGWNPKLDRDNDGTACDT